MQSYPLPARISFFPSFFSPYIMLKLIPNHLTRYSGSVLPRCSHLGKFFLRNLKLQQSRLEAMGAVLLTEKKVLRPNLWNVRLFWQYTTYVPLPTLAIYIIRTPPYFGNILHTYLPPCRRLLLQYTTFRQAAIIEIYWPSAQWCVQNSCAINAE